MLYIKICFNYSLRKKVSGKDAVQVTQALKNVPVHIDGQLTAIK